MKFIKGDRKLIGGVFSLGLGAFIAKLLGAIYRVPLTNLLGGEGLGLYQMVFPVYTVLLDFSGAGVPSALSKLISANEGENGSSIAYLTASLRIFFFFGLAFSLLLLIFARPLAIIQGNGNAFWGYLFLSPAVFLVSLLSCYRGYFQGLMNMKPTAISQVIEQAIKLMLGLILVKIFLPNVALAVGGATFAITLSELVAFLYLYIMYRINLKKSPISLEIKRQGYGELRKKIIKLTVPITIVSILIPLSQVVDSFLVLNILSKYLPNATSLYGLLSGVVATVIGLPVAICYGVATVAIPTVSRARKGKDQDKSAINTLLLTVAVALPATLICYLFAPFIIGLLFRSLSGVEKDVAISLLRVSSPCILLLSFLQTGNAVLIGKGKPCMPIISLGVGVIVKETLNLALLKVPKLNIYGGAVAIIACYFTVCLVNLVMIFGFKERKAKNESNTAYRRQYAG